MAIYLGTNKVQWTGFNELLTNGHFLTKKTYSFNLGQTNFSSLTPSTSSQNLTLPATTYTTSPSTSIACIKIGKDFDGTILNFYAHDYVVLGEIKIDYNYGTNNVNSTIHGIRSARTSYWQSYKYRTFATATGALVNAYNTSNASSSQNVVLTQKANNTYTYTTGSYGVAGNGGVVASSTGTATGNDGSLSLGCSGFTIRGHATYFPVETFALLNPASTIIEVTWYVYEGDKSFSTTYIDRAYELAANK